jgi:hypothetical protein
VLNFTIPQGAAGASGSGGGGGNTSGIPSASVYHSVQNSANYPYYSVNNSTGATTEGAPYTALNWMPNGCTATSLSVYSTQGATITVTLRIGTPGSMASSTDLSCSATSGNSCTASGSDQIPAGTFVDLIISGANSTPAAVWTALTCN